MRFLADECVDAALVAHLRTAGHDVHYIAEESRGLTDPEVLAAAREQERILLTEDKDFGELAVRHSHHPVPGILLLRIDPSRRALKQTRVDAALAHFGERLHGRYVVVHEDRFRSRPLRSRET